MVRKTKVREHDRTGTSGAREHSRTLPDAPMGNQKGNFKDGYTQSEIKQILIDLRKKLIKTYNNKHFTGFSLDKEMSRGDKKIYYTYNPRLPFDNYIYYEIDVKDKKIKLLSREDVLKLI